MSIRAYSVFVLSCVGSSLATRLITHPRSAANCLQDSQFHINESDGNRPESLTGQVEDEKKVE
jgi:hypothetical protein